MGRIEDLPDFQLEALVSRLERQLENRKTAAQQFGSSNLLTFVGQSDLPYEWSGVLPTDPAAGTGYGFKVLQVEATAVTMDNLFGDLIVKLFVGSLDNWYRPDQGLLDGNTPPTYLSWSAHHFDASVNVANRKTKVWQVILFGDDSTTAYLKFFVVGSDDVTIAVSEVDII